jgi:DNA repair and recombination protein RAD52
MLTLPRHGDHHAGSHAFGDNSPNACTEYTKQEASSLQDKLGRQLGPEWTLSREGPSRSTVYYIPTHKAIDLANNVFGFNGWSSSIKEYHIDFVGSVMV